VVVKTNQSTIVTAHSTKYAIIEEIT